ncbi:Chromatin structure-remodeling complex protein rsc9 [Tulasnella sp. 424]|nr:Chromatin structure-remodeling complex protein rsc9 [Tulasnella sp. 424]KAG8978653.1 Chromatin structure-remodeling complex protein rsc9 [Tulasnella sp. 425]
MSQGVQYRPPVADGHEQWYIDESPKNRMVLALLSGIDEEISWSLFRLGHLSFQHGHRFFLKPLFGLTDALMEWPMWWVNENGGLPLKDNLLEGAGSLTEVWAIPPETAKKRKHALESLLIIRNASLETANAAYLVGNRRTVPLLTGLKTLPHTPLNAEFIGYLAEIFQAIAGHLVLPGTKKDKPTVPLKEITELVATTKDRSLIISLLSGLATLYQHAHNSASISPTSPALDASIRYLPLTFDGPLLAACLDYLFAHLSTPLTAKAFLHHKELANTIKCLVALLLSEQVGQPRQHPLTAAVATAPQEPSVPVYQLTTDELQNLVNTPEPQRCMDWLRRMYVPAPGQDEIQGSIWLLYRDTFTPYLEQTLSIGGLANAADFIKKIMEVFPTAQAIVDPGPPQRYIIRGIKRRLQEGAFKCRWVRGACNAPAFQTVEDLYNHLLTHLNEVGGCEWATCQYGQAGSVPLERLKPHALTHLPSPTPVRRDPAQQPETITLPTPGYPHPTLNPTERPPPPPPNPVLNYTVPATSPPSTSLTALLVLRILFRTSFPDSGPAPPVSDENRFGFPMPPALTGEIQELQKEIRDAQVKEGEESAGAESERIGERNGRRAFERVASELAMLQLADESLVGWVDEMNGVLGTLPLVL